MEENKTLATELLHEVKASAKRWFIIAIVELFVILALIAGFLWYITLPIEEYTIEQEATDRSFNMINGGDWNGGETESDLQKTSRETETEEVVQEFDDAK